MRFGNESELSEWRKRPTLADGQTELEATGLENIFSIIFFMRKFFTVDWLKFNNNY